jgi:tight adherence protein B
VETKTETRTALGSSQVATSAVEFAGRVIKKRNLEGELERKLQAGAIALRPGEWFLIHTVATVAGGLLMFVLTTRLLPLLIGLVIGFLIPLAYLSRKERKRRDQFIEQLPDTLTLLASSLSAGHSFPQAVDAVVRNGQKPVADEFGRALNQSRVGVPIEDTLDEVAERMKCEDLSWVVMAVRINREVGGNLSEVLNNVANTLRERMYLKRQVKALSADGRLSTYVLTALPIVLALFLLVRNPTYIEPLFSTVVGIAMLAGGTLLLIVGWIWMKKLSTVEV